MGFRNPYGIADRGRHGLAAFGELERTPEISNPLVENMEPAKQPKLIVGIAELLGQFERPKKRTSYLVTIAPREHHRQPEGRLKLEFAPASIVGGVKHRDRLFGPALTFGQ